MGRFLAGVVAGIFLAANASRALASLSDILDETLHDVWRDA